MADKYLNWFVKNGLSLNFTDEDIFNAGYDFAKEEQDSNLTCDHCCNELGIDDGSIRFCGECKGDIYKSWTKVRDKQPELNQEVIMCRDGVINAGAFYAKNETTGGFVWLYQSGLKTAVDVNDYWQSLPEPPKED